MDKKELLRALRKRKAEYKDPESMSYSEWEQKTIQEFEDEAYTKAVDEVNYHDSSGNYWIDSRGEKQLIENMDRSYVVNCIAMVARKKQHVRQKLINAGYPTERDDLNKLTDAKVKELLRAVVSHHIKPKTLEEVISKDPPVYKVLSQTEYRKMAKKKYKSLLNQGFTKEQQKLLTSITV